VSLNSRDARPAKGEEEKLLVRGERRTFANGRLACPQGPHERGVMGGSSSLPGGEHEEPAAQRSHGGPLARAQLDLQQGQGRVSGVPVG